VHPHDISLLARSADTSLTDTIYVRLSTATTGVPHPNAALSLIRRRLRHEVDGWHCDIECHGALLGIGFVGDHEHPVELTIWDWQRGITLVVSTMTSVQDRLAKPTQDLQIDGFETFSFLDDQYLLVSCSPRVSGSYEEPPGLRVYSLDAGGTVIGSLHYPALQLDSEMIMLRFAHQAAPGGPSVGHKSAPFYASIEDEVLTIKLEVENGNRTAVLTHCISVSALRKQIADIYHGSAEGDHWGTCWGDWAIACSQLFYCGPHSPTILLASYGARFLECSDAVVAGTPKLRLILRDFSAVGVRKGIAEATLRSGGDYGWSYHCDDQSDPGKGGIQTLADFFDLEDVSELVTTLPYRYVSRLVEVPEGVTASSCSATMTENSVLLAFDEVGIRSRIRPTSLTVKPGRRKTKD
jgi:hypothetical protein